MGLLPVLTTLSKDISKYKVANHYLLSKKFVIFLRLFSMTILGVKVALSALSPQIETAEFVWLICRLNGVPSESRWVSAIMRLRLGRYSRRAIENCRHHFIKKRYSGSTKGL